MKEKHSDLILTSFKTYFNHQFKYEFNKELASETGTTSETTGFRNKLICVSAEKEISSVKSQLQVTFKYMLDF